MRSASLANPTFEYDASDPEGFRSGMFRLGGQVGARDTGTTLYELPPGQAVCPYHYEHGEEEWVLVLEGRPTLRTPEGTRELEPLDVVFFPKGPDGAHQIRNDTSTPARVLMWGSVVYPTVTVYPDSDKIGVWTQGKVDDLLVKRSSGVEYFDGEAPARQ
jgi:uncharacterized cupin superfamily protein